MTPTLMIMAGGTGGHVMPGLAVAREMAARQWQVVWLGNPGSMEADLVPRAGIPMQYVRFSGLRGKGLVRKLMLPLNLLRAFWQSIVALRATRPNVVLGMGGYVAFPGGMMAVLLNRPLVIHEQNSVAGLTNKVLARIADRVLEAFPGALPGAIHCGNPVRTEMLATDDPAARIRAHQGPLRILVVGGSQGARVLNETLPAALALLAPDARPVVTHQCGRGQAEQVAQAYREQGVESAQTAEFIDDVGAAYLQADLVVCRAGAMTVAELAAVGVASVLVPYPYAVDDHQTGNARYLADRDAAVLAPQPTFTAQWLADMIRGTDREQLALMAQAAREAALPQATQTVADTCEALLRRAEVGA